MVWVLLVAHVQRTGDPSDKKMSEALGSSTSSALLTVQLSAQGR